MYRECRSLYLIKGQEESACVANHEDEHDTHKDCCQVAVAASLYAVTLSWSCGGRTNAAHCAAAVCHHLPSL